jgi:hypothetical protein
MKRSLSLRVLFKVGLVLMAITSSSNAWALKTCQQWEAAGKKCYTVDGALFVGKALALDWKINSERTSGNVLPGGLPTCIKAGAVLTTQGGTQYGTCVFEIFAPSTKSLASGWMLKEIVIDGQIIWSFRPRERKAPYAKINLHVDGFQTRTARIRRVVLIGPPKRHWEEALVY